jgi:glycosyltransferase involved in cell wall biosynthesis
MGIRRFPATIGRSALSLRQLPAISVIVCARNEEFNLKKHLPAWLKQEYEGKWELIVVNDDSTDGTAAVVEAFQQEYTHLHLVSIRDKVHAGKKQALATGIRSATFDWLLFTDADCRPAGTGWIRGMAAHMTTTPQTRIVTGYGPLETSPDLSRMAPLGDRAYSHPVYIVRTRGRTVHGCGKKHGCAPVGI